MNKNLSVLMLEDVDTDAQLIERELRKRGVVFHTTRVDNEAAFTERLARDGVDLILADYSLHSFDAFSALRIVHEQAPDVPFILVSGALGEDLAVEALKRGATDYVLKHNLSRLAPAVDRA